MISDTVVFCGVDFCGQMVYLIGDRKVSVLGELCDEDQELVLSQIDMFKLCLNSSSFNYIIQVKKIVHLYTDILTIYSTLLRKIPNYDDITTTTAKVCLQISNLEQDFNEVFSSGVDNVKFTWDLTKSYEKHVKALCQLCVDTCVDVFDVIYKNLSAIDFFFNRFNNLEKLLIPFLLNQTKSLQKSFNKASYLFSLTTIADDLHFIKDLTPGNLKHLHKIEKITRGINREATILKSAFATFDPSLQQYTSVLLGKAILKREVDLADCQLVKRRDICFQAGENVVSIPLTEDQASNVSRKILTKYLSYVVVVLIGLLSFVIIRLIRIIFLS